jgi:hypothetical protein
MTTISFTLSGDAERRLDKQTKQIHNLLKDAGADFTLIEVRDALIDGIIHSLSTEDFKPEITEDGLPIALENLIKRYPKRWMPDSFKRIVFRQ